MAGLPCFYTPYPPLFTHSWWQRKGFTHTHTYSHTHFYKPIYRHTLHPDDFIINPIPFFWTFFFLFSILFLLSSVLVCSRQATLSYCSPGGWGPATFHQHLTPYQSTLSAWGKEMRVKARHSSALQLRKPAGCQQTSICKLGCRNVWLVTKLQGLCVSVCLEVCVCLCEKYRTSFVQWVKLVSTQPLLLLRDRCWTREPGRPFTPLKSSRRPKLSPPLNFQTLCSPCWRSV